jgi:hypothetical protein
MSRDVERKKCGYAEDLKGYAAKHASEARKLLSDGDLEEADLQLHDFERHLKE